jgi:hypothetical protein
MALITSAASGNFNAGATWTGGVVPGVGDEARAATGHTVTITANVTCDEVSNAGTGIFTLNDGVTLTANVTNKSATASRNCLQFTAASPSTASIVGNVTGGTVSTAIGAVNASTGTLTITGNCSASSGANSYSAENVSTGILNVTGNCTGGSGNFSIGVRNAATGTVNITGNVTGGTGGSSRGGNNGSTGTCSIVGIATGGTASGAVGVLNSTTGTVNLTRAKANAFGPGNSAAPLVAVVGADNLALGVIEIQELEFGDYGMTPTSGTGIRLKKVSTNAAVFNYVDAGSAKTLVDATTGQMPAATDVRDGVSYASGALSGSCAVPAAGSVALGVPVDAGFGTAVLTPESVWGAATRTLTAGAGISASDVWDYATRSLTTSSGPTAVQIREEMDSNSTKLANLDATVSSRLAPSGTLATVTTLTNAPTVPTAAAIATQVRSELTTELNRLDTNVGSRAASGTLASDVTAIKAKTDAVNVDRINNTATTAIVGNLLAQANS